MAYHAALPLVLTPELVNYLRNEFLRGEQVLWVAEVDLLLSDLCSQVGYELYAMDTHVRAYLLEEMKQECGEQRMQEVAQVLISYVSYLSRLNPGRRQQELEAQRWAAMVYLGDEKCQEAAQEIAKRLLETSSGTGSENRSESGIRAELARLTRITQELSPQLQKEPALLEYAKLTQQMLRTPETLTQEELSRSFRVGGMELKPAHRLLGSVQAVAESSATLRVARLEGFPLIQTFEFEVATVAIEDETKTSPNINLQPFEFEVATIELKQSDWLRRKTELIVKRRRQQAQCFIEKLGNRVQLEMVQIPGGNFKMGAPRNEKDSRDNERPQHQVTVPTFFMGKYPVTQAQWQAVAYLPQVNRELKADPSEFKGENRPVEQVSWYDAVEFCDRLSQYTGKPYRLPSEAEWEYSCRAGTTTPFHFGETITSDLANYNADYTYGAGPKGIHREETTTVDSFGVANPFGLYNMHGNVWELCADHWHGNYEGAPTNGSAWLDNNDNDNRIRRGGSWRNSPEVCRSAFRFGSDAGVRNLNSFGFRVACSPAYTQ
nr:formylglycine-generating enzyme family protein [Brasilonema octagenarum]